MEKTMLSVTLSPTISLRFSFPHRPRDINLASMKPYDGLLDRPAEEISLPKTVCSIPGLLVLTYTQNFAEPKSQEIAEPFFFSRLHERLS